MKNMFSGALLYFKELSFSKEKMLFLIQVIALSTLVIFGFLFRLNVFDVVGESFFHVDVMRDYLIASHVVDYGDFPLVGPDGYFGPQGNSPLYYYLLSFLFLFQNAILFPGLINVVLQSVAIVMVFFLARELFGIKTALASATLFTFADAIVVQAMQMWQPYLMQFFLLASFLFLLYGYRLHKEYFLYISSGLLALSAVIHNSVFAIIPLQLLLIAMVLYIRKASVQKYVFALVSFGVVFALSYAPTLYYFFVVAPTLAPLSATELLYLPPQLPSPSVSQLVTQTVDRTVFFFTYMFEGTLQGATWYTYVLMSLYALGSAMYLLFYPSRQKKIYFGICTSALLLMVGAIGALQITETGGFPVRYFTPVYALLFICVAEMCIAPLRKQHFFLVFKIVILIYITLVSSEYVRSRFESMYSRMANFGIETFYPTYTWGSDVEILASIVAQKSLVAGEVVPFDIRTFEGGAEELYKNELVWVKLESVFNQQLVHIDNRTFRGYSPLYPPKQVYIRCLGIEQAVCVELFDKKFSSLYQITTSVYESQNVHYLYAERI